MFRMVECSSLPPLPALPKDRVTRIGRYQLDEELAHGPVWSLHSARDGLGPSAKHVLLKVFAEPLAVDPAKRRDLAGVARTLRGIVDGGIAAVHDVVEQPKALAIVLEPLEGMTVDAAMRAARVRGTQVPIAVAVRIAVEVLAALERLHDLLGDTEKPSDLSGTSLFLTKAGAVKVLDFDLEPASTPLAVARRAPERQANPRAGDRSCDLWAVGVLLWELLMGKPLFEPPEGADGATYARTVAIGRVDQAGARKTDPCPPTLAYVVAKALSRNPAGRFASTSEMGEELLASVGGAIASPDAIAAFVAEVSSSDAGTGDRDTFRPPAPIEPPPLAKAEPEGRPAGKLALKMPGAGATTPKAPPAAPAKPVVQKTMKLPLPSPKKAEEPIEEEILVETDTPSAPPTPVVPPPAPGVGKTMRMEALRPASPTPPKVEPASPEPAKAAPTPPEPPKATPTPPPAKVEAAPPAKVEGKTLAMPVVEPPKVEPKTAPPPQVAPPVVAAPPAPPAPAPPIAPTPAPAPAAASPALAVPALVPPFVPDDQPARAAKQPMHRWVITAVAAAAAIGVLSMALSSKPKPGDTPAPSPSGTAAPKRTAGDERADRTPPPTGTTTVAPPSTVAQPDSTSTAGGDDRRTGGDPGRPGDPSRPPGTDPTGKATASEDKPPPPPPLRKKYNPKTI